MFKTDQESLIVVLNMEGVQFLIEGVLNCRSTVLVIVIHCVL